MEMFSAKIRSSSRRITRSFASWSNFLGVFEDFPVYSDGTKPGTLHIIDLIGFAVGRDFASVATLEVKSFIEKYPQGAGIPYKDLIVASSVTPSRTCEGDSGGPGYVGNTIVGVHTAGGQNLECEDGDGRLSWLTALTPERVEWISSIVGRGAGDVPVINGEAESQWNLSSYLLLSSSWR